MADNDHNNEQKEKCAHPSCACHAAADSKFCSAFCEGASDHPDIICNCGHAGCATRATYTAGSTTGYTSY
jgi:hypothetical protein